MKRTIFVIALIFALLCIISISALAVTSFPMESAVILGDVDRNGKVEKSVDTAAMQSKLLNTTISATEDINADGNADIADLVCLYLYADTYATYANNSGVTIGSSGSIEVTR